MSEIDDMNRLRVLAAKRVAKLEACFLHVFKSTDNYDACECGLDLRDSIHMRVGQTPKLISAVFASPQADRAGKQGENR